MLDNLNKIKKLDKSNMLGSIDVLHKQIQQAWNEAKQVKIPDDFKNIDKVVINGMGGSGLGAHIIQSIYFKKLKVPIGNIHSYNLPGIVDENTLYIVSSYSGNTEEPLSTINQAKKRGAKVLGITSAGKLAELVKQGQIPGYVFKPKHNPCNQPRMGIGYSVFGLFGLLKQCGVIQINENEVNNLVLFLNKLKTKLTAKNPEQSNIAKQLALNLKNRIPIIIASEFLIGNAHVMANQINENAKNFSSYFVISELNHHLMEGLAHPKSNIKNLHFVFFKSSLYHTKNQKRTKITQDIVKQNKIDYSTYQLQGKNKLEQSFEMLLFGSYISFYLAMLNKLDPSPIPWVDYFKEQLK